MADVAVTLADYFGHAGEAMAMGERTPVAVLDAPASGRLAVGEALTNILAADIGALSNVKLSANWMAACGEPGEDAALYATVHAVGEELCPALGIAIPVGKDSLSMKTVWGEGAARKSVVAPVSLIVSAFAPVGGRAQDLDAAAAHRSRRHRAAAGGSGRGREPPRRLVARAGVRRARRDAAGSRTTRSAHRSSRPRSRELRAQDLVLAYHDRSDGGVFATLVEMAFAGHCGLDVKLPAGDERRRRRAVLRRTRRGAAGESGARRDACSRSSCGTASAS